MDGTSSLDKRMTIGQITAAHGVQGEVRVFALTDFPERFQGLSSVILAQSRGREMPAVVKTGVIVEWTRNGGKYIILKLQGVDNRDAADSLRNMYIQVPREEAYPLAEGSYYISDIIGLNAVLEDGTIIGTVTDVITTGRHEVYEITGAGSKVVLVPAVKRFIIDIDLEARRIVIRPIPGLLD